MLRDVLKRLCLDGGWTYAVFWKIVECGGTRHLIWGDEHREPPRISLSRVPGFEATCSFHVQDHCVDGTDQNRFQVENVVGLLPEKIMRPKVHLGGCGIIGSALTGNHHWVLLNELPTEGYTSQELEELKVQFPAGIQTIAVIPVLPYGVIQLASTQMITQKEEFVHYARGLFLQEELVSGALFSESNVKISLPQKEELLPELTVSPKVSEMPLTKMSKLIASASDSCGHQGSKTPPSSTLEQLIYSPGSGIYEKDPTFADSQLDSGQMFKTKNESLNEIPQRRDHAVVESEHFVSVKQEGQSGTTFGFSIANEIQERHPNLINIESVGQSYSALIGSGFDSSNLTFLKQPMLPSVSLQESSCYRRTLGAAMDTHIGCQVHPDLHYLRDSSTASLLGIGESSLATNNTGTGNFGLFPSITGAKGTIENTNSSFMTGNGMLGNTGFSNNSRLASGEVASSNTASMDVCFTSTSTSDKWKIDEKSQPLDPACSSNSSVSRTFSSLESLHGCLSTNHGQGRHNFQVNVSDPRTTLMTEGQTLNHRVSDVPLPTTSRENSCLSFVHSSSDDLYDAVGLDAKPGWCAGKLDALFSSLTETNASNNHDVDPALDAPLLGISLSEIFSDSGHDQLLDAVVSKVNSNTVLGFDNVSRKTTLTNTSQSVVGDFPSHACQLDSSGNVLLGTCPALQIENIALGGSHSLGNTGNSTDREGDYKSQISFWVENHQGLKNDSTSSSNCKKIDEAGKLHKKRPKPGENPRPRPKDRQMIQDRVKELREIVPNGAKCSIDALLERTIRHMLFLQCVTKHADKLKETGEPKIINKGGLLLKDNFEGGATWAFEIGSQSMICPIIVEDLNPPRQLLVEMLCEDRGFFLEIADLIKGLGLTILKGFMEVRNAKVWARFAVEANRDVTRMDIFLSLVRLLEPNAMTNVRPSQGLENFNEEQNMFCQSSIPATGVGDE